MGATKVRKPSPAISHTLPSLKVSGRSHTPTVRLESALCGHCDMNQFLRIWCEQIASIHNIRARRISQYSRLSHNHMLGLQDRRHVTKSYGQDDS